ncbi:hypothetical protein CCAX7_10680 [Capsulimonas corticalis]|uniref:Uncharacterized protein n=1 Tax=Capsulimonas corticalis TaxID=2219043 RepID=A0A402CUN0_9BACT|nr:hypothetical protein [Capsulimonas corticalis]BDI29017.1 hypothetical protein CCAX7_10680 [Capsulimonas corticalis]
MNTVKEKKALSPVVIISSLVAAIAVLGLIVFKFTQTPSGTPQQITVPEELKFQRGQQAPTSASPRPAPAGVK